uniref:REJ domain-containing protein n=1 Tax=Rodentolepis nana TaxID=102285 RepID=A0A0R3TBJ9_RODNA
LDLKYDSIAVETKSVLTFIYTDGIPTSGEISVDSGECRPVKLNLTERVVYSEPMIFQAIGQHKVSIELCSERGSMQRIFDFWVEKVPIHYSIESNEKKIPVNTPITLTSRIQGVGSGGVIEVFDEYGYFDTQNVGRNVLISPQFTHQHPGFSNPGKYVLHGSLTIGSVNLSNIEIIYVMPPLGAYVLQVNQTRVAENEELIGEIVLKSGQESPCLDVSIDWDDGTEPTTLAYYQLYTPIKHTYTKVGQYSIQTVVEQNSVKGTLLDVLVEIGPGLWNEFCSVSPSSYITAGDYFELIGEFNSSENVSVTIDEPGSMVSAIFAATSPWSYAPRPKPQGIWTYSIFMTNGFSTHSNNLTVEIQNPVTDFSAYLEEENVGPPGDLILHVVYRGTAGARSNAIEVNVNWANETITTTPMDSTVNDLQLNHRMSKEGNLALNISVKNRASSQNMTLSFSFFRPIIVASVQTYIDQLNVTGYGVDEDYFTLDDSIRFESVSVGGTINATYLVIKREQGDEDVIFSQLYTTTSTVYKISELGNFKVIANMSNTINYYVFVKTIHVTGVVRGMRLSPSTLNLAPNVQGELRLSFVGLADAVCVCVDLGNGAHIAFPPVGGSMCHDCPSYTVLSRPIAKRSFTIPVLYSETRAYTITSSVGNTTDSLNVFVSEDNCYLPFTSLETSSIGSPNTPALIKVDDRLTIVAKSNGTVCSAFQAMLFKWLLFKLDSQTAERVSEINLPQLPSAANLKITLPPGLLMPGLFEVKLVGILNNVISYSGVGAYVLVSEMAPIIRFLENGEEMMWVSDSFTELCLSPFKHSYNPNLQNSKSGKSITNWHISCSRRLSALPGAMTSCNLPRLPGMNAGDFCINRTLLNLTDTYLFKATARVGQHSGVGNLQVTFVPGDVSLLKILMVRPGLGMSGIWDGVTSVSKTNDLALEGRCSGNCTGNFLWTIEREDQYGTTISLTPDELKLASKYFDKKNLVIQTAFLKMFKNSYKIIVCLLFTSDLNTKSSTCRRFYIEDPPMIGNCEINKNGEITKDTIVCISCEGSGSVKRPVLYRFQRNFPKTDKDG